MSQADYKLTVDVQAATQKAILASDGRREAWIPLSQIRNYTDELEKGKRTEITIPEWLAKKNGFL